jgi:hypothetical protein
MLDVIQPKRPTQPGWRQIHGRVAALVGSAHELWAHDAHGLGVITAVEVASEAPGMPPLGPAYHISISAFGQRCSTADAVWVLGQFDLLDAKEDNHVPSGRVRNFWRYVADNLSGFDCACTDTEATIREDRGDFVWRGAPR